MPARQGISQPSELKSYQDFVRHMKGTKFVEIAANSLLRSVYKLARERIQKERAADRIMQDAHKKWRPQIKVLSRALLEVNNAKWQIIFAQSTCAKAPELSQRERSALFVATDKSLAELLRAIRDLKQHAINELHPHFRRPHEKASPQDVIDVRRYDLNKVGWKPVEQWFQTELNNLLLNYHPRKAPKYFSAPSRRARFIQQIFLAGFGDRKLEKTIRVALHRLKKVNMPSSPDQV